MRSYHERIRMRPISISSFLSAVGVLVFIAVPAQVLAEDDVATKSGYTAHHETTHALVSSPHEHAQPTAYAGPTMEKKLQERLEKEFPNAPYAKSGMSHQFAEGVPLHGSAQDP